MRAKKKAAAPGERMVSFLIHTRRALPVGQQVFLSGNCEMLGNWDPQGIPLTRSEDHDWSVSIPFPKDRDIEFKITRGTWESEEIDESGVTHAENLVLASDAPPVFEHTVYAWKDEID